MFHVQLFVTSLKARILLTGTTSSVLVLAACLKRLLFCGRKMFIYVKKKQTWLHRSATFVEVLDWGTLTFQGPRQERIVVILVFSYKTGISRNWMQVTHQMHLCSPVKVYRASCMGIWKSRTRTVDTDKNRRVTTNIMMIGASFPCVL